MKNRHTLLLLVLFALAMIAWCLALTGCETQNPICSDNFCVVGEVFPRSELEAGQEFSEVDVDDSRILAVLVGTPQVVDAQPRTPHTNGTQTFANIISDVENKGVNSAYNGQTATVSATVAWKHESGDTLTISEDGNFRKGVVFFITSFDDASKLNQYSVGKTYTFTVYIRDIRKSTRSDDINIWSNIADD